KALREVRSRQNIPPKSTLHFSVRCAADVTALLRPMAPYFATMAGAEATAWGPDVRPPATGTSEMIGGAEVFVDLAQFVAVEAELARKTKELAQLRERIAGKERQLANASFVERAPAAVIDKERAALAQLKELSAATEAALAALGATRK